ncbi:MAG: hypothetical protein D6730_22895 [Bacteroidetes bacterium]|nr:MAG: hypothetical protein D6730_22895 [Bacteroidota bacterium]
MRDPLEKYILERKQELDVYEPDDRLWERIDKELYASASGRGRTFSFWKIAASLALMMGIGLALWLWKPFAAATVPVAAQEQPVVQPQELYPPELAEVEAYYSTMISNQKAQIQAYKAAGISIDDSMFDQLEELAKQYKELQKELLSTEDAQIVINAMIQNLSLQMEVLSQQLMILEQIKSMQHEHQTSL